MSMKERMHTGELYLPGDKEIMKEQLACLNLLYDFNMTRPTELEKREKMLQKMFAEIGEGCYIEPPLHTNFGGAHVHFGKNVYANFNLTLVDDTHIYVGDNTMFGPGVIVATAGHPILPSLAGKRLSVQHAGFYRQKLLDWCRRNHPSRGTDWRQCSHRRWQCCNKGYSFRCCCCGKSMSCAAACW